LKHRISKSVSKWKFKDIDVVLCDVKLPDGVYVDFVQKIKLVFPLTEVILLTGYKFPMCSP
jgi:YesN/AraC family two-component response regulator